MSKPTIMTGLRPYRSDRGPYARVDRAMAIMETLKVIWTMPVLTPKLAWIAGRDGRKICIERGPNAVEAANRPIKKGVR